LNPKPHHRDVRETHERVPVEDRPRRSVDSWQQSTTKMWTFIIIVEIIPNKDIFEMKFKFKFKFLFKFNWVITWPWVWIALQEKFVRSKAYKSENTLVLNIQHKKRFVSFSNITRFNK
jgi:hypothetical protein